MKLLARSIFIAVVFLLAGGVQGAYAQYFKFDASSVTQPVPVGSTFNVKILINTAGVGVIAGDALFGFDPSKVSIDSAESGNFFTYFSGTPLGGANNKYLVSGWEESVSSAKSSSSDTLFATLSLTAKTSGTAVLSFDCTVGSEADSNINQASDSKDIIKCSEMTPVTIALGTGGPTTGPTSPPVTTEPTPTSEPIATSTPVPTSVSIPTNTPHPVVSAVPRSGVAEVTFVALGVGVLLTIVGALLIL